MRAGDRAPVQRVYQGDSEQSVRAAVAADEYEFLGMTPRLAHRDIEHRRFRSDIVTDTVVWEEPEETAVGVRLHGIQPIAIWEDEAQAKLALKELRLVKRTFTANKREASGMRTAARRAGEDAKVANYAVQVEGYERGILATDAVIRDIEFWMLRESQQ